MLIRRMELEQLHHLAVQYLYQIQKATRLMSRRSTIDVQVVLLVELHVELLFEHARQVFGPPLYVYGLHTAAYRSAIAHFGQSASADSHFFCSLEIIAMGCDHHALIRLTLQKIHRLVIDCWVRLRQTQELAGKQHVKAEVGGLCDVDLQPCCAVGEDDTCGKNQQD